MARTRLYHIWAGMRDRCRPESRYHRWYSDRGISVCPRWQASFEAFAEDVGQAPSSLHTLDRVNNDGNYEPGNVRWATRYEQMQNTSRTLQVDGVSLSEWSSRLGIAKQTLSARYYRGLTDEEILAPVLPRHARPRGAR